MKTQRRMTISLHLILIMSIGLFLGVSTAFIQASIVHVSANEPYGLNALTSLDRLPYLKLNTMAGGQSSFDRADTNNDFNNFLYTDTNGDKVMLDLKRSGTVYRMWFTGFASNATIKIYCDGASTPQFNGLLSKLFDGSTPPFLPPLVANDSASSGGFVSYVPLTFHSGIKITTNGSGIHFYYNIGYHMYSPDTNIPTWTGKENSTAAQTEWNQASLGKDPIPTTGNSVTSGTVNLASSATQPLLDIDGPQEIQSIKLHIPDVVTPHTPEATTDNGRAYKGTSQFTLAINSSNQGVYLKRRFDYGVGNQKAIVSVDGQQVGTWFNSGSDTVNRWRDSSFFIPSSYTANKSSITVKITFVSSTKDWNEFIYWAYSVLASGKVPTDSLNVGNTASEAAHHYTITGKTWTDTQTFTYPVPDSATTDILNNLWLKISWDNETTPSAYAPIGSLFGLGQFGIGSNGGTRSLMMGLDETNTLYLYFPMPFQSHAHIDLVSQRSSATNGIAYEIQYKPFTDPFQNVGYFKTQFNATVPTTTGKDALILDTQGAGQFLGVVDSMQGTLGHGYLEGNERIYTDGNNSPIIQGTGTEDFFNGGWYFNRGPYTNQMSGNTVDVTTSSNKNDETAAYRLFLQDAVPFRSQIHVSIEHGTNDNAGVNDKVWALAYYYLQPARETLTDTLDVGNAASEAAHSYSITNQTWQGSRSYTFEGINNATTMTDDGRAHTGTSQFTMAIDASNQGVILRRRFDQGITNQQAQVLVNGSLVGTWYKAGANSTFRWREEDFMIPTSYTSGKSSITITLHFVSSGKDWSEFRYQVFSEH